MDFDLKRGVLALAILVTLGTAIYLTLGAESCPNFECFQTHMSKCTSATYVNEEPEASWQYHIKGASGDQCEVEVTLLIAREGNLKLRQYEGNSMSCFYDIGVASYPEKDLDACHGELKENIQSAIIDNLYRYIVDNLDEIKEEIGSF